MVTTVKNLTNSPYDLPTPNGFVRLPAFGEVSGEFGADYVQLLEASMAVSVIAGPPTTADGGIDRLRGEYADLTGKKADGRWSADRIQSEIDKALAE